MVVLRANERIRESLYFCEATLLSSPLLSSPHQTKQNPHTHTHIEYNIIVVFTSNKRHGKRKRSVVDGDREPRDRVDGAKCRVSDVLRQGQAPAAGLCPVGEPQVREAGLPLSDKPRHIPGHYSSAGSGVQRRSWESQQGGVVEEALGRQSL